jgi:hypothetical protein
VSIVILLVLVAVLWIVVLIPSAVRRLGERQGSGSIDHFHRELKLLEHAGPKRTTSPYRVVTAQPGGDGAESLSSVGTSSSGPKLVLLRPVDDRNSADIEGVDGAHYERVGVIESPEPPVSPAQTQAGLTAYRRQEARRRCTLALRLLTAAAITTGILGALPSFRVAWIFTALTGLAALALVGLVAYAREMEGQRRRPTRSPVPMSMSYHDEPASFVGAAQSGLPGAWDDEDETPLRRAAAGR